MAQQRKPLQFKAPRQPTPEVFAFPQGYAGGINISTTPDLIAPNQSPEIMNMNYDHSGVPSKRYGFDAINATAWGTQPTRGTFEYEPTEGVYKFLVAWNGKLWSVAADGTKTDLCTGSKTSIADAQVDFFVMNGKCYFLTGTEYCYYDGTNPVAVVTGKAPLVFTGIAPNGTGGLANEDFNFLSNSWKLSYSGTAGTTAYVLPAPMTADSIEKVWANGTELTSGFSLAGDKKTINFTTAPGAGTDNVIIQPTKAALKDATVITHCRFHALYGGKDDTRVFLSGNPAISNGRYHSGLFDPTYFPEDGEVLIGSDSDSIRGMGRVGDYLLNYKERQIYYTDIEAADSSVIFPVRPMNDEHGCTSWRTVQPAQGGLLALSYDGVIWCLPSTLRGQLTARVISQSVNRGMGTITGMLQQSHAALEAAHAYIWRNKYILHIGTTCWVLDLEYSALSQGVYCWYPYDGLFESLTQFIERQDGLLWAGDTAGKVYKSNEEFNDAGVAIDGYWTSPMVYGSRNHLKRYHNLHITYGSQAVANHKLFVTTEDGEEPETEAVFEDSRAFNFDDIDFDNWTFGSSPYPEPVTEKVNLKAIWVMWKVQNNTLDQGLTLLSQALTYSIIKELK